MSADERVAQIAGISGDLSARLIALLDGALDKVVQRQADARTAGDRRLLFPDGINLIQVELKVEEFITASLKLSGESLAHKGGALAAEAGDDGTAPA